MRKIIFTILALVSASVFLTVGVLLSSAYGTHQLEGEAKRSAFYRVFPSAPSSVQVTAYGYRRYLEARGSYILVFKMPREELCLMLEREGFVRVAIDSDPGRWRLSLLNDIIGETLGKGVQITRDAECFERRIGNKSERAFYSSAEEKTIYFGGGSISRTGMPEESVARVQTNRAVTH